MKSHGARVSPPAAMSNMEPESRIQGPDVLRFNFLSILNSIGARVLVPVRKDPAAMWMSPQCRNTQHNLEAQPGQFCLINTALETPAYLLLGQLRCGWRHPRPLHL